MTAEVKDIINRVSDKQDVIMHTFDGDFSIFSEVLSEEELIHYGRKGMKWGKSIFGTEEERRYGIRDRAAEKREEEKAKTKKTQDKIKNDAARDLAKATKEQTKIDQQAQKDANKTAKEQAKIDQQIQKDAAKTAKEQAKIDQRGQKIEQDIAKANAKLENKKKESDQDNKFDKDLDDNFNSNEKAKLDLKAQKDANKIANEKAKLDLEREKFAFAQEKIKAKQLNQMAEVELKKALDPAIQTQANKTVGEIKQQNPEGTNKAKSRAKTVGTVLAVGGAALLAYGLYKSHQKKQGVPGAESLLDTGKKLFDTTKTKVNEGLKKQQDVTDKIKDTADGLIGGKLKDISDNVSVQDVAQSVVNRISKPNYKAVKPGSTAIPIVDKKINDLDADIVKLNDSLKNVTTAGRKSIEEALSSKISERDTLLTDRAKNSAGKLSGINDYINKTTEQLSRFTNASQRADLEKNLTTAKQDQKKAWSDINDASAIYDARNPGMLGFIDKNKDATPYEKEAYSPDKINSAKKFSSSKSAVELAQKTLDANTAARKALEESAKKKAEEDAAAKKALEDSAKKRVEEEAARQKAANEEASKKAEAAKIQNEKKDEELPRHTVVTTKNPTLLTDKDVKTAADRLKDDFTFLNYSTKIDELQTKQSKKETEKATANVKNIVSLVGPAITVAGAIANATKPKTQSLDFSNVSDADMEAYLKTAGLQSRMSTALSSISQPQVSSGRQIINNLVKNKDTITSLANVAVDLLARSGK